MVQLRSGDDRGKRGRVLRIDRERGRVTVEGVAYIYRHVRKSQKNPQGGRLQKEAAISLSRVQWVCPSCQKPSRVGVHRTEEGERRRVCRKCRAQNE
jgi:large subunit ribosomal protein L24